MISFISKWAEQVIIAVIVATIIELILPNNKNKKYIQMVIGVYILFTIISPIISNKEELVIEKYNNLIENTLATDAVIDQSSMDKRLEKIYLDELEKDVKKRFEDEGITVKKCNIEAELDTSKKNAGINLIKIIIKGPQDETKINEIKNKILTEYEIDDSKVSIIIK